MTCRWCGADLTVVQQEVAAAQEAGAVKRLRHRLGAKRLPWVIAGLLLLGAVGIAPWLLFAGGEDTRAVLLNPPSGERIGRRAGEIVQIDGIVLGGPGTGSVSVLVDGEEIWSESYKDATPPIPSASWTAEGEGTHTVTLLVEVEEGEATSDVGEIRVRALGSG